MYMFFFVKSLIADVWGIVTSSTNTIVGLAFTGVLTTMQTKVVRIQTHTETFADAVLCVARELFRSFHMYAMAILLVLFFINFFLNLIAMWGMMSYDEKGCDFLL